MKVYLDNAATTPVAPEIIEMMSEMMKKTTFANPSSIHSYEDNQEQLLKVHVKIAKLLNTSLDQFSLHPRNKEITIIWQSVIQDHSIQHAITS